MTKEIAIRRTLKRARKRIAKRENWCQHTSAQTRIGHAATANSSEAVAWCASGAIQREAHEKYLYFGCIAKLDGWLHRNSRSTGFRVSSFNDSSEHEQVLWMFDGVIKEMS